MGQSDKGGMRHQLPTVGLGSHLPQERHKAETVKCWVWPAQGLLLLLAGGVPPLGEGQTGTGADWQHHRQSAGMKSLGAATEQLAASTDTEGQEDSRTGG